MGFTKAEKGKKPLRLVISGASGAGKSWTSLLFAKFLAKKTGKRTAAIDTEHGRLSLYADRFDFDVIEAEPPFHPNRLIALIHEAEAAGYGQLIIDSSTHYYNGSGGLLEIVAEAAKTKFGGNSYMAWNVGTPLHNSLIDTIIRSPMHIIVTVRAKQAYAEQEKNGRKTYEKQGYDMQQKDGLDYELDFAIMMDMENNGLVTKGMDLVPPGTYFKHPSDKDFELILKAIEENTVGVTPTMKKEEFKKAEEVLQQNLADKKAEAIALCGKLGGQGNEKLMALLTEYHPTANPKKIEDLNKLNELIEKLKLMDTPQ